VLLNALTVLKNHYVARSGAGRARHSDFQRLVDGVAVEHDLQQCRRLPRAPPDIEHDDKLLDMAIEGSE